MVLNDFLEKIKQGQDLSAGESQAAFDCLFEGEVSSEQTAAFLLGLHRKGETVDELRGAVASLRNRMVTISAPAGAIDIVGTGGDMHGTLNISTAVAFVAAACGVPVAKHGTRAVTSRSGSSDLLSTLGINLEPEIAVLEECLAKANLCFLFAPRHHPAMRYGAEARKQLGMPTIFNLIGPLANPANVKRHLIGVYDLERLGPMAEVLQSFGSEAAWLAHGHDGMDEITTTDATDIVELRDGAIRHFTLEPEQVGLPRAPLEALKGGDAAHNAAMFNKLLDGETGPYRDIVLFNAAAALIVAGKVNDLRQGLDTAKMAIDNGSVRATLAKLIKLTNESRP